MADDLGKFLNEIWLVHHICLATGELFCFCIRDLFKEQGEPSSFRTNTEGTQIMYYYHVMLKELAKLLHSSQTKVIFQSVNTMQMLYNTCGFCAHRGNDITGPYGYKPKGHIC